MDSVYRQQIIIQLGVDGSNIIDSTKQRLEQIKDTMEGYALAVRAGQMSQAQYLTTTEALAEEMVQLNDILKTAKQSLNNFEGRMQAGAFGLLAMSHAAQDFVQSGFPAVINNIPQISYAIGQLAGWSNQMTIAMSGISMVGALVINTALPSIKQFAGELGIVQDHSRDVTSTLEGLKTKLKALEEKPWKIDLDRTMIDHAREAIEKLQSYLAAYKSATGTDLESESARAAKEAVTVYGGGSAKVGVALEQYGRATGESFVDPATAKKLEAQKQYVKALEDIGSEQVPAERERLRGLQGQAEREQASGIQAEIGKFLSGDFQAVERMQGRIAKRGDLFGDMAGPGGLQFAEFVQNMAGSAGEQRRRMDQDTDMDAMFEGDQAQLQSFKKQQTISRQQAAQRKAEEKRAEAEEKAKQREEEAVLNIEARENEKAFDKKKADEKKAQREVLKRSRDAMKRARGVAGDFDDGMEDDLMQAMLQRGLAGKGVDGLDQQVMRKMIAAGVNPNDAMNASQIMVEDTQTKMNARLTGMGGLNRNNAINLLAEMSQKQAVRDLNAGNRQARLINNADQNNLAGMFQANGFNDGASTTLAKRTLALMDKGVEMQQAQTLAIQELQQQMTNMQAKLNRNQQQMQRGRQRGRSLLPVLFPQTR